MKVLERTHIATVLVWLLMARLVVAADTLPNAAIKLRAEIGGRPAVGFNELKAGHPIVEPLSDDQKTLIGKAFDKAVFSYHRDAVIPFVVSVLQSDGTWRNVTSDRNLIVDVMLGSLMFERTGKLIARPEPGMPGTKPGFIITLTVMYFPKYENHKDYGMNQYYFRLSE